MISLKYRTVYIPFLHISILISLICFACEAVPAEINYGIDGCYFCKMTIVDRLHAAEIVTKKGKVYKFDASECMINTIDELKPLKIKFYLSNDYNRPEELIDATKSVFLISENIPSPMSENLSAFKSRQEADAAMKIHGGTLYTWSQLLKHLKK